VALFLKTGLRRTRAAGHGGGVARPDEAHGGGYLRYGFVEFEKHRLALAFRLQGLSPLSFFLRLLSSFKELLRQLNGGFQFPLRLLKSELTIQPVDRFL